MQVSVRSLRVFILKISECAFLAGIRKIRTALFSVRVVDGKNLRFFFARNGNFLYVVCEKHEIVHIETGLFDKKLLV